MRYYLNHLRVFPASASMALPYLELWLSCTLMRAIFDILHIIDYLGYFGNMPNHIRHVGCHAQK